MDALTPLIHLGDPRLAAPGAIAVLAWLLAARAWRLAFWWGLLFAAGMGLVAAAKIAFLGWGLGLPALAFKAPSGHAAGAAALLPMLFWLLLARRAQPVRLAGAGLGLGLGALVGVLLVLNEDHSAAEALAGWLAGAAISLGSIRLGAPGWPPRPAPALGLLWATLALLAAAWLMDSAYIGYWMIKAARLLSGNLHTYSLTVD